MINLEKTNQFLTKAKEKFPQFDYSKVEIVLFNKVKSDDEPILLTETQILATFLHKLMHSFQWHIKGETDEWEAQSYSGLMIEFLNTKNDEDI